MQNNVKDSQLIKKNVGNSNEEPLSDDRSFTQSRYLLTKPHGGILVNRIESNVEAKEWLGLPKINVGVADLMNIEQIAIGAYSPLEGFLTKNEVDSVLNNYCLPNGTVWTLPITLQIDKEQVRSLTLGDRVVLCLEGSDEVFASLEVADVYSYDLDEFAQKTFATKNHSHPGVSSLHKGGSSFLAGKVQLFKRLHAEQKRYELTPAQVRSIFKNKCWNRVVGFHTRNVAHRAHEYIQKYAFEEFGCDGIFIHPLIGPKKSGDYVPKVILRSYEMLVEKYFTHSSTLISAFQSYPRYSGPREAVFTAICRKNFGCSHFIVGRDHSGVGNFYAPDAAQKLFVDLGDIGITPIFFKEVNYCKKCAEHTQGCGHGAEANIKISGTEGREMIKNQKMPPDWCMRKNISEYLIREIKEGREVFVE